MDPENVILWPLIDCTRCHQPREAYCGSCCRDCFEREAARHARDGQYRDALKPGFQLLDAIF